MHDHRYAACMPRFLAAFSFAVIACGAPALAGADHDDIDAARRCEWAVNAFKPSLQGEAAVAVDPTTDDAVVTWSSRRQQHGRSGVYLQRFTRDGVAIGGETPVQVWARGHESSPAIASAAGVTWVAWQSHGRDGQGASILARRFSAAADDGANPKRAEEAWAGSSEILVNEDWLGDQTSPVVAASDDGGAMIVWTTRAGVDGQVRLAARRFDAAGNPIGDEFAVASPRDSAASQNVPSVAFDGGARQFLVAYAETDARQRPRLIMLRRFDNCGKPLGEPLAVSGDPAAGPMEPVIAAASQGGSTSYGGSESSAGVVAWIERLGADQAERVMARRIGRDGNPAGKPFAVESGESESQVAPAAVMSADGGFVIAWNAVERDGGEPESRIMLRRFGPGGQAIGDAEPLNEQGEPGQAMRLAAGTSRLALERDGSILCAWNGAAGGDDDDDEEEAAPKGKQEETDPTGVYASLLAARDIESDGVVRGAVAEAENPDQKPDAGSDDETRAEPHVPPTFDPRQVDRGEREFQFGIADVGFTGILNTGWTPPDHSMAAGPNHLVVLTNGAIAWFLKDGTQQFLTDINGAGGFWGSLGVSGFVFDPEALYDDTTGRFFVMASEGQAAPNGTKSFVLLAVSDDSDPNGTWHKYRFDTTALSAAVFDSPNLSVDANVVYITGDKTATVAYPVYTFDKASLLAGLPPAVMRSTTMPTTAQSAGMPPISYDNPPAQYLIEHAEGGVNTFLKLIALTDPLGTPTFTTMNLTVPSYTAPEDPPQMGTAVRPETFDARLWSVAYRNGRLWACHHQGSTRVLARWYEIAMNGWPTSGQTPSLVQSGAIDPGGTVRTFFPAITVDSRNDATIVFARSSPTEFISMNTVHRDHADAPGTFQAPVPRKANTAGYTTNRWGDYGGIAVDPADGRTIWAHHEYAVGNSWRTWIAGFTPPSSCPADVASPHDGMVDVDDLFAVINNWDAAGANPGDVTGNGVVDIDDLFAVINAWGPCP